MAGRNGPQPIAQEIHWNTLGILVWLMLTYVRSHITRTRLGGWQRSRSCCRYDGHFCSIELQCNEGPAGKVKDVKLCVAGNERMVEWFCCWAREAEDRPQRVHIIHSCCTNLPGIVNWLWHFAQESSAQHAELDLELKHATFHCWK